MTHGLPRHSAALMPNYVMERNEVTDVLFGILDHPFTSLSSPDWNETLALLERSIPERFTPDETAGWVRQIRQMLDWSREKYVMKYHVACALLNILEKS